jgi:hypothetical protein
VRSLETLTALVAFCWLPECVCLFLFPLLNRAETVLCEIISKKYDFLMRQWSLENVPEISLPPGMYVVTRTNTVFSPEWENLFLFNVRQDTCCTGTRANPGPPFFLCLYSLFVFSHLLSSRSEARQGSIKRNQPSERGTHAYTGIFRGGFTHTLLIDGRSAKLWWVVRGDGRTILFLESPSRGWPELEFLT